MNLTLPSGYACDMIRMLAAPVQSWTLPTTGNRLAHRFADRPGAPEHRFASARGLRMNGNYVGLLRQEPRRSKRGGKNERPRDGSGIACTKTTPSFSKSKENIANGPPWTEKISGSNDTSSPSWIEELRALWTSKLLDSRFNCKSKFEAS